MPTDGSDTSNNRSVTGRPLEFSLEVWALSELSTGESGSEMCFDLGFCLSGWGDLNSRPSVPQTDALTKLRHSP